MVLAGYVLAFVSSVVAVAIYDRRFTPADNQTMGGMIAGGEMMYGIAIFLFVSVLPTGLALWFLRRHRPSWSVFSAGCLVFAIVGLAAAIGSMATRGVMGGNTVLGLVGLLGLVQMLGSPLWVGGFLAFALLAPARDLRMRMLAAVAVEVAVGGCAIIWFLLTNPAA